MNGLDVDPWQHEVDLELVEFLILLVVDFLPFLALVKTCYSVGFTALCFIHLYTSVFIYIALSSASFPSSSSIIKGPFCGT